MTAIDLRRKDKFALIGQETKKTASLLLNQKKMGNILTRYILRDIL